MFYTQIPTQSDTVTLEMCNVSKENIFFLHVCSGRSVQFPFSGHVVMTACHFEEWLAIVMPMGSGNWLHSWSYVKHKAK